jgi:hypothetical protein
LLPSIVGETTSIENGDPYLFVMIVGHNTTIATIEYLNIVVVDFDNQRFILANGFRIESNFISAIILSKIVIMLKQVLF